MFELTKRFQPSPDIVGRFIDDEVVIVPIRGDITKQNSIFSLEHTAAKIWPMLVEKKPVGDILDFMAKSMNVSLDEARRDLEEFLGDLLSVGAIEETKEK